MSAPGSYEAPVFRVREFIPSERRDSGAINQLGRTLDRLCLEAVDPYEIAAHLEALGYNNGGVAARYGVADHFELARALFYRTPRRLKLRCPKTALRRPYARQAVMVLTLFVTAAVGLVAGVAAWVGSGRLAARLVAARRRAPQPGEGRAGRTRAGAGAVARRLTRACRVGDALALQPVRPRLPERQSDLAGGRRAAVGGAAALQGRHVWPFVLYGLGQSCLLLALLRGAGPEALPGVLLFALVLLASEGHLLVLRGRLNDYLWRGASAAGYARFARQALARYAGGYLLALLPALVLLALPGPAGEGWLFHLAGFALFGLVLGLALVWLSLGKSVLPALVFAAGGALVAVGVPFLAVAGVMALAEFAALLRRGPALGRYGVFLV